MNKKPGFLQKAEKTLAGKGFYMVLLLCLVILGASGYFLFRTVSDLTPSESAGTVSGSAEVAVTIPKTEEIPVLETQSVPDTETLSPMDEVDEIQAVDEPVIEPVEEIVEVAQETPVVEPVQPTVAEEPIPAAETAPGLSWPVQGEIVAAFSATELTYNAAMGDWRTHSGVDISASLGTEVLSAADGSVESIVDDPLTGTTVTLTHAGGLTTVYGNLDPDTLSVSEGDTVSAGQLLACVGSSAAGEENGESFLHFAVLADGVSVDPSDYLN